MIGTGANGHDPIGRYAGLYKGILDRRGAHSCEVFLFSVGLLVLSV